MSNPSARCFTPRTATSLVVPALMAVVQACTGGSSPGGPAATADAGSSADSSGTPTGEAGPSGSSTGSSGDGLADATRDDSGGTAADASTATGDASHASACTDADAASAIVCDDFELPAPGSSPGRPWQVAKNSGSVLVDATRAFRGRQSVRVTAPAAAGYRSVMLRVAGGSVLPTRGNVVYGRMMFWLDSAPTASVHWTFVDGSGLVGGTSYHAVYRYGGQLPLTAADGGFGGSQLMASYDTPDSYNGNGPASDCYRHSQGRPVPVAAWTCAEWEFEGPNNTMRFWLDGAALTDLTVAGTGDGCTQQSANYVWAAPSFGQIDLGLESYQADDARTMWIDDVVIGTTRVGCP